MHFLGRVPYDREVTRAMVAGKSLVEFSDGAASQAVKELWGRLEAFLSELN